MTKNENLKENINMFFNLLDGATTTPPADTPAAQNGWLSWVLIGVVVVLIVGMMVWQSFSNKKKQKQAAEMINQLKPGDKIKTIGGVCGYLVEVDEMENTIVIETGSANNKCHIKFDKNAIYQTGSATAQAPASKKEDKKEEAVVEEVASKDAEEKAEDKE